MNKMKLHFSTKETEQEILCNKLLFTKVEIQTGTLNIQIDLKFADFKGRKIIDSYDLLSLDYEKPVVNNSYTFINNLYNYVDCSDAVGKVKLIASHNGSIPDVDFEFDLWVEILLET
jgi:hypothetical protein